MTKIKLCGLSRLCDIEAANELRPEFIGFVFAPKSKRYVSPEKASELKEVLHSEISAVGVFVNEPVETVADLFNHGTIDVAQLHGNETDDYIDNLRKLIGQNKEEKLIIKVFQIDTPEDLANAECSTADYVLLDSGNGGTGATFNWELLQNFDRPYFLAGGLSIGNISEAIQTLSPYAVDVSSGIETNGQKDKNKMAAFVAAVRKEDVK